MRKPGHAESRLHLLRNFFRFRELGIHKLDNGYIKKGRVLHLVDGLVPGHHVLRIEQDL